MKYSASRRWILAMAFSGAAPGVLFSLPTARAQQPATEPHQDWVHLDEGAGAAIDMNIQTGTKVMRYTNGGQRVLTLEQTETGTDFQYSAAANRIIINAMRPEEMSDLRRRAAQFPTTVPLLLTDLAPMLADKPVKSQSIDRGLERTDLAVLANADPLGGMFDWFGFPPPTTVWADPQSHRIRELRMGPRTETISYGPPEIHSIYDAGAPKNAVIEDLRPSAETVAVFDRIVARCRKPMPDGVAVELTVRAPSERPQRVWLEVYGRSGAKWWSRQYDATIDTAELGKVQIPPDWQGAGAEEFFRRLAITLPHDEDAGDADSATMAEFDPKTGDVFTTSVKAIIENGIIQPQSATRKEGPMHATGDEARMLEQDSSALLPFFPLQADQARYSNEDRLELITAPDRQGQIGLRNRSINNPDAPEFEEWYDTAHADRPVVFYVNLPGGGPVHTHNTQKFGDYVALPDGRFYAATWTDITYNVAPDGSRTPTGDQDRHRFHFFPGRKMPEIPKAPPGGFPQETPGDEMP